MTATLTAPAGVAELPVIEEQLLLDVDQEAYHRHPALSSTPTRLMLDPSCPALAKHRHDNPEQKDYFDFGHVVHTWALGAGTEPELLVDDNGKPFADMRTNAVKAKAAEIRRRGGIPMLEKNYSRARAVVDAIRTHPYAGRLLAPGTFLPEHAVWWTDERTGLQRRAMFDAIRGLDGRGQLTAIDVKSTTSTSTRDIAKTIAKFRYHQQDESYRTGLQQVRAVNGTWPAFVFVFVEKDPPHLVRVVQLNEDDVWWGAQHNRQALDLWIQCTETGHWPGHSESLDDITLPNWVKF